MSFHDELQLALSSKRARISKDQFLKTRRTAIERLFGYRFTMELDEVSDKLADIAQAAEQVYGAA